MMFRLLFVVAAVGVVRAHDCDGSDGELAVYPGCGEEACTNNDFCAKRSGTCIETSEDPFFRCECADGFENLTPLYCIEEEGEMPDPCDPDPCKSPSAACQVMNNTWTPTCICPDFSEVGYVEPCPGEGGPDDGDEEATAIASCDPNPCGLGASCMLDDGVAVCMCFNSATNGYDKASYGNACEDPVTVSCEDNPCGNKAKCYDHNPGFKCACQNGEYKNAGENCLESYDSVPCDADLNLCDANASCASVYLEIVCTCNPPYQGNGFECTEPGNSGSAGPLENPGESGASAGTGSGETASDACPSDACGKHATCEPLGPGLYQCYCGSNRVANTVSCS